MTAATPPPSPFSPPSVPPAPVAAHGGRRWFAPAVAALVAAGAGVGLGWLLWAGPDGAASGTGLRDAAADAAGACQVWQRVPPFSALNGGDKDAPVQFNRALAAAYLGRTAADLDDRYKELGQAFQEIEMRLRTYKIEGAEAEGAHEKVTSLCTGLDD